MVSYIVVLRVVLSQHDYPVNRGQSAIFIDWPKLNDTSVVHNTHFIHSSMNTVSVGVKFRTEIS